MTAPSGMSRGYHGVTYRCVQNGKAVETVTVPLGEYEDTRLGLECLDGTSGWERVSPGEPGEPPEPADHEDQGVADDAAATPDPEPRPRVQDPEPAHEDEDTQEGGE